MIDGMIPAEIREEGDAIRMTLSDSAAAARAAAATLVAASVRRIYIIGNGTSYHSALAAATWFRRSADRDDPVVIALTAGEFSHYLPALGAGDALVGISASGEFRDVLAAVELLRGRIPTIGVVHVAGSGLERLADHVVRSGGGPSHVPVMTKTYVSTLTAALLLLAELWGGTRADQARAAIAGAAEDVEKGVADAEAVVGAIAEHLLGTDHVFVTGSGNATAAAYEAALKLKEIALVHAEGAESWEMASGAATLIGPESTVVAIAPNGPGRDATLAVAQHAAGWGAQVIEIGPADGGAIDNYLPLPTSASEDLAPLTAVAPVALLAFALARLRGQDPDRPAWVERYHSQGLHHIVGA